MTLTPYWRDRIATVERMLGRTLTVAEAAMFYEKAKRLQSVAVFGDVRWDSRKERG